jgi:hypothetical protein
MSKRTRTTSWARAAALALATLSTVADSACDDGTDLDLPDAPAAARAGTHHYGVAWSPFVTGDRAYVELAGAPNADGTIGLFLRTSTGEIFYTHELAATQTSDWSTPQTLDGWKLTKMKVATNADGRLEVFAMGGDGYLYHRWQAAPSSASFSGWSNLGNAGSVDYDVIRNQDGRLEVAILRDDGVIFRRSQVAANGGWGDLATFPTSGGSAKKSIALTREGRGNLVLLVRDNYGEIFTSRQLQAGHWTDWVGFATIGGHDLQDLKASSNADGRVEAVALGGDGVVYADAQGVDNIGYVGWVSTHNAGRIVSYDVARSSWGLNVVAVDANGQVQHLHKRGTSGDSPWEYRDGLNGRDLRYVKLISRTLPGADNPEWLNAFGLDKNGRVRWTRQVWGENWVPLSNGPGVRDFRFMPNRVGPGGMSTLRWDVAVPQFGCTPVLKVITPTNDQFFVRPQGEASVTLPRTVGDWFARLQVGCQENIFSGQYDNYGDFVDAHILVDNLPALIHVSVDRDYINQGESTTLRWSTNPPADCQNPSVALSGKREGWGDPYLSATGQALSGSITIAPEYTAMYSAELRCGGVAIGTADKRVSVYVPQNPPVPTHYCKITRPGMCAIDPYWEPNDELALNHCQNNNLGFHVELVDAHAYCPLNP